MKHPLDPTRGPDFPSHWHRTALEGEEVDLAIVGAGIAGVMTAVSALELRPELNALLIDPWGVAGAASGRNAGFLIAGNAENYADACRQHGREKAKRLRQFSIDSVDRAVSLVERFKVRCDCARSGSHIVATSQEEDADLCASADLLREDGFRGVSYLESPPFGSRFYGALHNPNDGEIHPARFLRGLARAAGLRVEAASVEGIEPLESGAFRVATDQGAVRAKKLCLCANAYLDRVAPGLRGAVRPVRGQVLVTRPMARRLLSGVAYCNDGFDYFRQLPDGRLLMGGCRDRHVPEEVGYGLEPTQALQSDLEAFILRHFPEVGCGLAVEHRWSGTMGFSQSGLPFVGATPDGAFVAAGFTGHGMSYGSAAGLALARLALLGEPCELLASPALASASAPRPA